MILIQESGSFQTNGARTSDWIGRLKGGVIYAYDIGALVSESVGTLPITKEDFRQDPEKVIRKIKK